MKNHFEVHYMLPKEIDSFEDVHFINTYRGKAMRRYSTAEKTVEKLKKDQPQAYAIEIAEYDERGRID